MTARRAGMTRKVGSVRPLILSLALLLVISPILSIFSSLASTGATTPGLAPALAATTTTTTTATKFSVSSGVIVLNSKNFDSELRDGNVWLIEFYAPWCSHCTRFAPAYEGVATKLHGMHSNPKQERKVKVAKINGADERALTSRFGIHGFPSFFLVDGWKVRKYEGARSHDSLVKFCLEKYEDVDPIPFLFGPFGPMGQVRALLMWMGSKFAGIYDHLTKERGMSQLVAAAVMCASGMFGGVFSIVLIGFLLLPKPKID